MLEGQSKTSLPAGLSGGYKQGSRASFLAARYQKETRHAFRWGSVAMVAFLYARVSMNIDLSHFVVLLNAFKGIAAGLESIAADLGQISIGLAALRKVADALNSETQRTKKLSMLQRDKRDLASKGFKMHPSSGEG